VLRATRNMLSGVREWIGRQLNAAFLDDFPELGRSGINQLTLTFKDRRREEGFLAAREGQLAHNLFCCSGLVLFYVFSSLIIISLDSFLRGREPLWATSGGSFMQVPDALVLAVARNSQVIASICICAFCCITAKSKKIRHQLGPAKVELVAVMGITAIIVLIAGSTPWYLARMFGVEPRTVVREETSVDDATLLLALDAFITTIHVALPIRWAVLWPTEVFFVLVYAALVALGSPMPPDTVAMNLVMISVMSAAAALGKRSLEFYARAAYVRVAEERSQRAQVEHRLHLASESRRSIDGVEGTVSVAGMPKHNEEVGSLAETADSGAVFSSLEGVGREEAKTRLERMADLGYSEHWLIPASDLVAKPENVVGAGGYGIVMEAIYHGAPVVLKFPGAERDTTATSQSFTSIAHELRMLRRLRHPNIVLCYGACIVPVTTEILLVLEYVRGTRLGNFIDNRTSPPSTELRIKLADDICCALRYLHSQKPVVVHGDIKCSNTLVEELAAGVNAKLVDFGLSRLITRRARPLGGTFTWMAPEVMLKSGSTPAPSADVFSFGRLLFMIMTGRRPLAGVSKSSILEAVKAGSGHMVAWTEDLPYAAECADIYNSCTSREPANRPTVSEVQDAFHKRMAVNKHENTTTCLEDAVQRGRVEQQELRAHLPRSSEPIKWSKAPWTFVDASSMEYSSAIDPADADPQAA